MPQGRRAGSALTAPAWARAPASGASASGAMPVSRWSWLRGPTAPRRKGAPARGNLAHGRGPHRESRCSGEATRGQPRTPEREPTKRHDLREPSRPRSQACPGGDRVQVKELPEHRPASRTSVTRRVVRLMNTGPYIIRPISSCQALSDARCVTILGVHQTDRQRTASWIASPGEARLVRGIGAAGSRTGDRFVHRRRSRRSLRRPRPPRRRRAGPARGARARSANGSGRTADRSPTMRIQPPARRPRGDGRRRASHRPRRSAMRQDSTATKTTRSMPRRAANSAPRVRPGRDALQADSIAAVRRSLSGPPRTLRRLLRRRP